MVEPAKKKVEISFDDKKALKRWILPTATIGELITKSKGWFKIQEEIADLVLELEGSILDPTKKADDYPNLFTQPIRLRISNQPTLSSIVISMNSSEEKELRVDINLPLSEVAKKVFGEMPRAYFIQIDGIMINPRRLLHELPHLDEIVIEFFTENVEIISVMIENSSKDNPKEYYSVSKLSTFTDIMNYVIRTKDLDPKFYIPTIDGKTIEGSKILNDIPDISSLTIEFQKINAASLSEDKEHKQAIPEVKQEIPAEQQKEKNSLEEQKKNQEPNMPIQKKDILFLFESRPKKITVSPKETMIEVKRKIQQLLNIWENLLIFYDSLLLPQDTCPYDLMDIENSALIVKIEEEYHLYFKRRLDGLIFSIPAKSSTKLEILKTKIHEFFNIEASLQVWMLDSEIVNNTDKFSVSDTTILLPNSEKNPIEVFEFSYPLERQFNILKVSPNGKEVQTVIMDSAKKVKTLKEAVSSYWGLGSAHKLTWKSKTNDTLNEEVPLCAQIDQCSRITVEVKISKEVTIMTENQDFQIVLPYDVEVMRLKEMLFPNHIGIPPKYQKWIKNGEIEDSKKLYEFGVDHNLAIFIEENKALKYQRNIHFSLLNVKTGQFDSHELSVNLQSGPNFKEIKQQFCRRFELNEAEHTLHQESMEIDEHVDVSKFLQEKEAPGLFKIFPNKKFRIVSRSSEKEIAISLGLLVKDVIRKIRTEFNLENIDFELLIDKTKLSADKILLEYSNFCKDKEICEITVISTIRLNIILEKSSYLISIKDNQTIEGLMKSFKVLIREKNENLEFYYSNTRLDSTKFNQLLKGFNGKVLELNCSRGIELTIEPEELAVTKLKLKPIKILSKLGVLIKDLTLEVNKKLQFEPFVVKLMYNDKELLDDLSVDEYLNTYQCNTIKCRLYTKVQIFWENHSTIQVFHSTMTVQCVVKALKTQIPDIDKKELFYKGKPLSLATKLHELEIFGGDHIINVQNKPSLVIEYLQKTFEFPLEQDSTREELESAITDHTRIATDRQLVIITKNNVYINILTPACKKLSDLVNLAEYRSYKVFLKRKFPVEILLPHSHKSCVNLAYNELISLQKKIIELESKIPADKQEWMIESKGTCVTLSDDATLESYDKDGDQVIKVAKKLTLYLCMAAAELIIIENVISIDTIKKAKKGIEKQIEISQAEQKWFYQDKEMLDHQRFEDYLMKDRFDLAIDVVSLIDFEYFGFNEASPINSDLFTNFYLESNEDLNNIIDQTEFISKNDDIQFRNKILSPFFAVLKKHSLWEHLINSVKDKVYEKKKIKLWKGNHFNTEYLLSYILNSKIPKLNFGMLSLLKNHIPIPLTMRTWEKRHKPEKAEVLDDVYWLVQPCFTIASVGVGVEKRKVKGKSLLNNMVFFTNFLLESQRNPVCEGCVEIKFDIYKNEKFLVNFIEIADETDEIVKNRILKSSNLLVIHSTLQNQSELDALVESMKGDKTIPTIIFHRDATNAFENPTLFTDKLDQSFAEAKKSNRLVIDVENLSNSYSSNIPTEIKLIYKIVHDFIMINFKNSSPEDLWKFTNFFDGYNNVDFKKILTSIEKASSSLCTATKTFEEYISLQRNNVLDSETKEKQSQILIKSLEKKGLSPQLQELVSFIYSSQFKENQKYPENPSLILVKLQNFLRNMKIKQTMDFYKLYTFHSDLSSKVLAKPEMVLDNFSEYWKELKGKASYFNTLQLPLDKSVINFSELIRTCIDIFEQKYLPEIFSMELLWREMIYMTPLLPTFKILDNSTNHSIKMNLEQALVDLSKSRVQDGFPFEIIDGDLLHVPKEFLKKVFGNFKENAVVVSVLGPQSSGKSTLLNFLFGCDFSTSSGRCTKGIYGTFLKLSNFNACGGVLLLDTEGLFGLLNKAESDHRDKFHRKLVLFCLAISDVVLVNFRGDLDKTLTDLLRVTLKDSLIKLQQGNTILPEMMLILNQNAQTTIETQLQDIDKMTEFGFSVDDVAVLPLAFDTKEIKLDALPDPIIKKDPKPDFSEKCRNITDKVFQKIGAKQIKQRTLEEIFDTMEKIWETMTKYPQLLKHSTLKDREVEESMKNWVNENVDIKWRSHLNEQFSKYKGQLKNNLGWEENFEKDIKNQENNLKQKFKNNFEKISENHTSLYSELEDYLQQHLNQIKKDFHFELTKEAHNKKIKIWSIEGEDHIKQAIRESRNNPDITPDKKEKLFETAWNKVLSGSLYTFDRKKEDETLFKIICEKYHTSLINLSGGLPEKRLTDLDFNITYEQYQKILIDQIQNMYLKRGLEESKGVPSRVLDGGIGNVSFKYFDMKKYFNLFDAPEKFVINRSYLREILDIEKIRAKADASFLGPFDINLSNMAEDINRTFEKFGFTLDQRSLKQYLEYKMKNLLVRFMGNIFHGEPEIMKYNGLPKINDKVSNDLYVDVEALKNAITDYHWLKKYTLKHFIKKALGCIEFDHIKKLLTAAREESYQNSKIDEIINEVNNDLQKINCQILKDRKNLNKILTSGDLGSCIDNFVTIDMNLRLELHDLTRPSFTYIRSNKLAGVITKIKPSEYNKKGYLLLGNSTSKNYQVKKDYSHITWLEYYAKNDFGKMIYHSSQNKILHKFVLQEFNLKKLLHDIYECCDKHLRKSCQESVNSMSLYRDISNDVNNLIGVANNDLQQACYKLDFNISANVHFSVVYLIWIYFEETYWNRINQPLYEMKNQKEKQWKFFSAMTSQNKITIANAEVEDFSEKLIKYWKDKFLVQIKKNLINRLAEKFNKEGKRAKIQKEIDEKYFGRAAQINLDELYKYICDPHKILEAHYKDIIDKYVKDMRSEFIRDTQAIKKLMATLKERIISLFENLNKYTDGSFDHFSLYQPKKPQNVHSNEVFYQTYDEELRKINFEIFVDLFRGNAEIFNKGYRLDRNLTVIINPSHKFSKLTEFKDPEILKLLAYLTKNLPGILNILNFLTVLIQKIDAITEKLLDLKVGDEEFENFKNLINYHICKQKCPCCDRICGEDDPLHKYHQCKYGHQMRAIGGIKLNDGSASVSRCEDIGLNDLMHYNGAQKTWMEFKEEMKNHPNNPWVFNDLEDTKRDTEMKDRFKYAWTLIGQKICSERYKGDLKYVEYNQANLNNQKRTLPPRRTYIFIIDSSSSMSGNKWIELLGALKTNLGVVHNQNKGNKVTIIKFSSSALVEYSNTSADKIPVASLAFQGRGTNFEAALQTGLDEMKKNILESYSIIFLSDGESSYPQVAINAIKSHISGLGAGKFEFTGLEFQCTSNSIKQMCQELNGKSVFVADGAKLSSAFYEIITKKI